LNRLTINLNLQRVDEQNWTETAPASMMDLGDDKPQHMMEQTKAKDDTISVPVEQKSVHLLCPET
jgi:hypothetical protein